MNSKNSKRHLINLLLGVIFLLTFYSLDGIYDLNSNASRWRQEKAFRSPLATEKEEETDRPKDAVSTFKEILGRILGSEKKVDPDGPLKYEVFGFLPFWTLDKRIYFRYELLSTIAYFGLDINSQGEFIKERDNGKTDGAWAGWLSDEFSEVIRQAKKYKIKVLLTIKGFGNETIENLLQCSRCRSNLVANAVKEVKDRQADGVNIDFEYVGTPDDDTVFRFTQLARDFVDTFRDEIPGSYITVSTYAKSASEKKMHDIKNLAQIVDSIFIMGYDFFRPVSRYAGPVAPLGGAEKYSYDLKTTIDDYLKLSPPGKIILGLPYYGYDWPVESDEPNAKTLVGSEETGYANMSSYVNSQYDPLNDEETRGWDSDAQVPFYSWFDKDHKVWRQAYYEDVHSLSLKYNLIKEKGLRGVGIWALGYDGSYPELWDLLEEKFTR